MFPTVRLLIAAIFASIVVLSCGFGVFAAFRVNHAPLSLQTAASVPLKFAAAGEAAAASANWGAPFGPGLRASEDNGGGPVTDTPTFTPIRNDTTASNPWTAPTVRPAAMTDSLPNKAPDLAKPLAATTMTEPGTRPAPTPAAPGDQVPGAQQTVPAVVANAPAPLQAEPGAQPADVTGSIGVPPLPDVRVLPEQGLPGARGVPAQTERKIAHKPAKRSRVVRGKNPRRAPAAAVAQFGTANSPDQQTVFQSAPHFQEHPQSKSDTQGKAAKYPVSNSPFGYSAAQ